MTWRLRASLSLVCSLEMSFSATPSVSPRREISASNRSRASVAFLGNPEFQAAQETREVEDPAEAGDPGDATVAQVDDEQREDAGRRLTGNGGDARKIRFRQCIGPGLDRLVAQFSITNLRTASPGARILVMAVAHSLPK